MAESPLSSEKIETLERRLAADPGSPAFLALADAYRRAGRPGDAEHVLRDGLDRHPEHHSARTFLGRLLLETGRPGEARDHLEEVIAQVPDNLLARRLLDQATGATRGEDPRPGATPPLGAAAPSRPASTPRHAGPPAREEPSPADELSSVTLAELYLRQGDRVRALEIYRDVVAREPGNPEWRRRLQELIDVEPGRGTAPGPIRPSSPEPSPEISSADRLTPSLPRPHLLHEAPGRSGNAPKLRALRRLLLGIERVRGGHAR